MLIKLMFQFGKGLINLYINEDKLYDIRKLLIHY
jgi:hypothetical protein